MINFFVVRGLNFSVYTYIFAVSTYRVCWVVNPRRTGSRRRVKQDQPADRNRAMGRAMDAYGASSLAPDRDAPRHDADVARREETDVCL